MPGVDILDQRDPLGKPFAGSLLFHGGIVAFVLVSPLLKPHIVTLGDPTQHAGSIGVSMVRTIPIPQREGPINRVANQTQSIVPEAPEPKVAPKPVLKEKLPPPDAIKIPTRDKVKPKRIQPPATSNPYRADRLPEPNQVFSHAQQALVSPELGMKGTNGIGVGPSNPFGEQFGWYAQQIFDRVGQKWNRSDVTSRLHARAVVRFRLVRDGSVQDVQLVQQSGSYTLDTSAQRAVMDATPLPPFPRGFPYNTVSVDLNFELQQ
jgi:protein TonB